MPCLFTFIVLLADDRIHHIIVSQYYLLSTGFVIASHWRCKVHSDRYDFMYQPVRLDLCYANEKISLLKLSLQVIGDVRFTVIATILEIIDRRPWYFRHCPYCKRRIFDNISHAYCQPLTSEGANDYRLKQRHWPNHEHKHNI